MQTFEVRGGRDSGRVRIQASGELDLATTPRLEACVRAHVRGDTRAVELDLRGVGFVDSTGVRLLLALAADAQRDGWSLAILPSGAVRRILGLLGLQRLLAAHVDAAEQGGPLSTARG